ncbi:MAG: hypothetical protein AAFV38_11200 [Pseudomonadota bacterium]
MTPRVLRLTEPALADIQPRAFYLSRERGPDFATMWVEALIGWLERIAASGTQLGTEHPSETTFRTFGYKRQATILAEFLEDELRVIRVYFPGQDWAA